MSDFERLTFFIHWLSWVYDTEGLETLVKTFREVQEKQSFKDLPTRYRGNVEGVVIGFMLQTKKPEAL